MKAKILVLAAALVIIASGCTGQGNNVIQEVLRIDVVGGGVEDISIRAEMPEFARPDRDFNLHLLVTPAVDINNMDIVFYDRCGGLFAPKNSDEFKEGLMLANRTKAYETTWTMGQTQVDKCTVRFKTAYTSNMTLSQGIVTLTEAEWFEREQQGTRKDIAVASYRTTNPLRIDVSFSQDQPLIEQATIRMYLDYADDGTGIIRNLQPGDVKIKLPGNLELVGCDDYALSGGALALNKQKSFINKKASRSTCEVRTKAGQIVDSRVMIIEALYGYEIDSYFNVNILKV
ncbi:MAG: hypothetical protein QXU82_02130 [Candidatus Aenigmatarchaeota archaeon]